MLDDGALAARARAVFDDVRATSGTDCIDSFRRAVAHDPETLEAVWSRLNAVTVPGALAPMVNGVLNVAVSTPMAATSASIPSRPQPGPRA